MNHIIEVMSVDKRNCDNLQKFKKISKSEYVNLDDGEILEYKLNENRSQNISGIKKTFKALRNLINNNFSGNANELHIVLTYAENMTDTKRLYMDFDKFWKKFKYRYKNVDYISVIEPQGRGAWHIHLLVRFNAENTAFINNDHTLNPMWGHGITKVKSLDGNDNIGAYLTAYFSDLELTSDNESAILESCRHSYNSPNMVEKQVTDKNGNIITKKFLKGARLYLYPSGMNLYRRSKGIIKPTQEEMQYKDVINEIVGSAKANYSRTIEIRSADDNDRLLNKITYEQYNLKRDKRQGDF